jgi:hypothetical protein
VAAAPPSSVMELAALQLVELHLIAGYRTGTFQRPDPPARNNGPGLAIMRRLRALARHDRNDASPPDGTQRVRWRVIAPPGLSSRSSPMRRPSEAQFVVFSLKSFVQDLVGSRLKVFRMAIIAGANQDRDPAVDVSFVAPLPKCHLFHALCHAPLFADFTNDGFVFDCHLRSPGCRP